MSKLPLALQLYSVRDFMEKDVEGTIKAVASFGYEGVEFAGTFGLSAKELKAICDKYGVYPISAHVGYHQMRDDLEGTLAYYKELGCKYFAVPHLSLGDEYRPGTEKFDTFCADMEKIGKRAAELGITLQYHNHDFEFEKIDGEYILDILYGRVSSDALKTQIDTCWANVGGEDPAAYVRKYAGRAPSVHLKDFSGKKSDKMYALIGIDDSGDTEAKNEEFSLRICGKGYQNFPEIIAAAKDAGAEWLIIEQDSTSDGLDSLSCAKESIEYIKTVNV